MMIKKQTAKEAFFSANIHCYMPDMPWDEHPTKYQEWRHHHAQKQQLTVHVAVDEILHLKPGILVMYHLGQHSEVLYSLARQGVRFDIVLSKEVRYRYAAYFEQLTRMLSKDLQPNFILAEDRTALLKMRSSNRRNRQILLFADGFVGTKDSSAKMDDRVVINFYDDVLHLRQGIGFISYLLSLPVYPLVNRIDRQNRYVSIGELLLPMRVESRMYYIKRLMQRLYDLLALQLAQDPMLWECWPYLYHEGVLLRNHDAIADGFECPHQALVALDIGDRCILFDKANYRFLNCTVLE